MFQETKGCCQGGDEGCMGSVNGKLLPMTFLYTD